MFDAAEENANRALSAGLNEYHSDYKHTGHNTLNDAILYYILPK